MRRIGVEPSVITGRNNVITRSYWTRLQERVKLVDYRRSRTDLISRGRQWWTFRFRVVGFDNGNVAGVSNGQYYSLELPRLNWLRSTAGLECQC